MTKQGLFFIFVLAVCLYPYAQRPTIVAVQFQGNGKTKTGFLKKIVALEEGMSLDSSLIRQDIYKLKRLPSVSHAYFQVHPKIEGVEVVYGIEENFTLIPFANVYTSNDDEFAFRVGLQEFNAFGQNITLGGFYQHDIFNSLGIHVRIPHVLGKKWGLAVNYQDLITQEPIFLDNGTADYKYTNESFEILGLYQLDYMNRAEFGVNFFTEDYEYLSGVVDMDVPRDLTVNKRLLKFIYSYDGLRYHYQYLEGFRSTLNLQYVNSADDRLPKFLIGFNDFSYFHKVGAKGNWASRLRLGLSSNLDTPFAPFAVDNNLNIRGVGNTIDRGTAAIVLNTEYRHTLVEKSWFSIQGNVFIDGGTWRNPGGDFSDFGDNENLRIYPGLGVRFIHRRIFNAIFRIDYGHGITNQASRGLVFGIGQYF